MDKNIHDRNMALGPIKNNFETIRCGLSHEECHCPDCKRIEECGCDNQCDACSELWDQIQERTEAEIMQLVEQINQRTKLILCRVEGDEIIVDFRPWAEPDHIDFHDLVEEIMRFTVTLIERDDKLTTHGWFGGIRGRLCYKALWGNGTVYGILHFEGDDLGELAHIHYYNNSQCSVSKKDMKYESYDPYLYRWLIACEQGDLEYIMTRKISYSDVRANNYQALHGACRNGHLAVAEFLRQYYKLDFSELAGRTAPPSEDGSWGRTLTKDGLADSESEKRNIVPQLILEAGSNNRVNILNWIRSNWCNCPYSTFLKILAFGANLSTVQYLIKEDSIESPAPVGYHPSYRHYMSAEELVSKEFVSVCQGGQVPVLEWLRMTDYIKEDDSATSLEVLPTKEQLEEAFAGACENGHLVMAKHILGTYKDKCPGFNPLAQIENSGTIRNSLKNGWVDLLKYLIEDLGLEVKWTNYAWRTKISLEAFRYVISKDPTPYEEGQMDDRTMGFILSEECDFRVAREIMERPELGYTFPLGDLREMCRYGHLELAKYHAERSKPSPVQFLQIYQSIKNHYNAPVINWCLSQISKYKADT